MSDAPTESPAPPEPSAAPAAPPTPDLPASAPAPVAEAKAPAAPAEPAPPPVLDPVAQPAPEPEPAVQPAASGEAAPPASEAAPPASDALPERSEAPAERSEAPAERSEAPAERSDALPERSEPAPTASETSPAASETSPAASEATAGAVAVRVAGSTDVGRVREHNEDNYLTADLTAGVRDDAAAIRTLDVGARGVLLAVCDGMGGAAAGEVASKMAVDIVHTIVQQGPAPASRDQFAQRLVASIEEAGARIFLAAKSNRQQRGMGTTATVAGVFEGTLFVGQVGDSRAYVFRRGQIRQITKDQSLVSKLIEAGQLTEAEAETYEHSHIILQALGTADTVAVDLSYLDLRHGDALLLCSDGLSGLVTADQMREVLATMDDPASCCEQLTLLANEQGGHDNVTVIVARFGGALPEPRDDDEPVAYQPYVLAEPVEALDSPHFTSAIKDATLPPPGKDIKDALAFSAASGSAGVPVPPTPIPPEADDDPVELPVHSNAPLLAWGLVALVFAGLALAAWLLLRARDVPGEGATDPPPPAATPDPTPPPLPLPPPEVPPAPAIPPAPAEPDAAAPEAAGDGAAVVPMTPVTPVPGAPPAEGTPSAPTPGAGDGG